MTQLSTVQHRVAAVTLVEKQGSERRRMICIGTFFANPHRTARLTRLECGESKAASNSPIRPSSEAPITDLAAAFYLLGSPFAMTDPNSFEATFRHGQSKIPVGGGGNHASRPRNLLNCRRTALCGTDLPDGIPHDRLLHGPDRNHRSCPGNSLRSSTSGMPRGRCFCGCPGFGIDTRRIGGTRAHWALATFLPESLPSNGAPAR